MSYYYDDNIYMFNKDKRPSLAVLKMLYEDIKKGKSPRMSELAEEFKKAIEEAEKENKGAN